MTLRDRTRKALLGATVGAGFWLNACISPPPEVSSTGATPAAPAPIESPTPAMQRTADTGALVFAFAREPEHLNPYLLSQAEETRFLTEETRYLNELIYDGLVNADYVDGNGKQHYVYALMKEFTYLSPDNKREVFITLRDDVHWHKVGVNGSAPDIPFTARDVEFTWNVLHNSSAAMMGWLDYFISGLQVLDDHRIKLSLKVEGSPEVIEEILSTFKILPALYAPPGHAPVPLPTKFAAQHPAVRLFNEHPIGTGPYRVTKLGMNTITFDRNPNYWTPAKVPQLEVGVNTDPNLRRAGLINDQYDLAFDLPISTMQKLSDTDIRKVEFDAYNFFAIAYNASSAPFDNVKFRQGINSAIDKAELFQAYVGDQRADAKSYLNMSVYPHNFEFVREAPEEFAEQFPYSTSRAKELLEEAGVTSAPFAIEVGPSGCSGEQREASPAHFKLLVSSEQYGEGALALANSFKAMLEAVDVAVEIDDVGTTTFNKRIRARDFQAAFYRFDAFNHLYDLRPLFGPDATRNHFALHDPNLVPDLAAYAHTLRRDERQKLSRLIHRHVEGLAPACFLFTMPRRVYANARVRSVAIHPEAGFASVEQWFIER